MDDRDGITSANAARTDADLDARIRAGDRDAFSIFFCKYYPAVVQFAARYVRAQDVAEDIGQDAMIRVWERRDTLDPTRTIVGFVFTAARNRAFDLLDRDRTATKHAEHVLTNTPQLAQSLTAPAADEELLTRELAELIAAQIAAMPQRLQEIYHMHREDGLSPKTIAEVLGIAPPTVYVHLSRIVRILQGAFDTWRGDSSQR